MSSIRPVPIALALALLFAASAASARADTKPPDTRAATQQLGNSAAELKKQVEDLDKTIADDTQKLKELSSQSAAQKAIGELQGKIGSLLAKLADNGELKRLADKILAEDRDQLEQIKRRTYDPALRRRNEEALQKTIDDTEVLVRGIAEMRQELTKQLKVIQNNQDFIEDSIRVGQAAQMAEVLRDLLAKMRSSSDRLKRIMSAVPGV